MTILSWGRINRAPQTTITLHDRKQRLSPLAVPGIAYGMGRSYGDQCFNRNATVWLTRGLDRYIAFDANKGRLRCEAGVVLRDIQRLFMPRGWMLPVVPGTQLITVGGAIANDVHGKNHHGYGTFAHHITELVLLRTSGERMICSPTQNSDWFNATIAGMGLTGLIIEVELQLRRANSLWLDTETLTYQGLDNFFALSQKKSADWEHTVSWFDCTRAQQIRGVFLSASPSATPPQERPSPRHAKTWPFEPPLSLMNRASLALLNNVYYWSKRHQAAQKLADYESFLFPLDAIDGWNQIYGPNGFYQYQCVLPNDGAREAVMEIVNTIARAKAGSFLAVLKTFGDRPSRGMLSFAQAGVTLALDFPNQAQHTMRLFSRLDAIVQAAKGKLYLAKDGHMSRALFESTYEHIDQFKRYRDPGISSSMSQRLMGF